MFTIWTKNLKTEQDREQFKNQLLSAQPVLDRLTELLNEKENELGRSERTMLVYDSPSWAYQQAHRNGYASALSAMKTLIDLDRQKEQ